MWPHLVFGPLLLLVSIWFWKFPPSEINSIYGYRTPRSMASQEAWDFANRLSARWLIWISVSTIICQVITILTLSVNYSLAVSGIVFLALISTMIPVIETKLKREFVN